MMKLQSYLCLSRFVCVRIKMNTWHSCVGDGDGDGDVRDGRTCLRRSGMSETVRHGREGHRDGRGRDGLPPTEAMVEKAEGWNWVEKKTEARRPSLIIRTNYPLETKPTSTTLKTKIFTFTEKKIPIKSSKTNPIAISTLPI